MHAVPVCLLAVRHAACWTPAATCCSVRLFEQQLQRMAVSQTPGLPLRGGVMECKHRTKVLASLSLVGCCYGSKDALVLCGFFLSPLGQGHVRAQGCAGNCITVGHCVQRSKASVSEGAVVQLHTIAFATMDLLLRTVFQSLVKHRPDLLPTCIWAACALV